MSTDHFIPYGRQSIDEQDLAAVAEVLRGDLLTTGPYVDRFEARLCELTGARHAVAVNSGTAALHVMYFAAGIGAGDEIVTSPLTFAATANAALYLGATVRFADIDPETGLLDPRAAVAAITPRTRAIVPVDYTGQPFDVARLAALLGSNPLPILIDAAHSLGGRLRGQPVGTLGQASATSFHPVKPITTGEGGAVLTDDPELARRARQFRTHGIVREAERLRLADEGPWYHEMQALGYNYRLTDIQCALGTSQLRRLSAFIARRQAIAAHYLREFAEVAGLGLPVCGADATSGWHLFVVRILAGRAARRTVFERLRAAGLGVQVHYLPVYLHPHYLDLGYRRGLCPNAERFYDQAISLPIFPAMTDAEVEQVVATVRRVMATAPSPASD